jgi:hypothetical protein
MIKLTSKFNRETLYINVEMIGSIYKVDEETEYGKTIPKHTTIGHLTHNNGGFKVLETVEEVLELIKNSKPI